MWWWRLGEGGGDVDEQTFFNGWSLFRYGGGWGGGGDMIKPIIVILIRFEGVQA